MPATQVQAWLSRKVARAIAANFFGGVGLFLAAALVLFMTFWIVYAVVWFVGFEFRKSFTIPHAWCVGISLAVLGLLFFGNATTDREYLSEFSLTTGTVSDDGVVFWLPSVGVVSNVNPLAPDYTHNFVKMITDVSFSGPRLVVAAWRTWQKARRLRRMDVANAAEVMAILLAAPGKVAFAKILPAIGKHDPGRIFPPLGALGGVLFLKADPPGMTLTPELRAEFHGAKAA